MEPNFREWHRKIAGALVRKYGSHQLEAVLDAIQEAFITAIQSWPIHGQPDHPVSWLRSVAERRLIDTLRRDQRLVGLDDHLSLPHDDKDELALYFMACSPSLSAREQVCLLLRTLAGLSAAEIGKLLHESEEAVQKRITRAKGKVQPDDLDPGNLAEKLEAILLTLYLTFTEGYEASRGEQYLRPDLAYSALRLAEELRGALGTESAQLEALIALFTFNIARLPARVSEQGESILLADQDRSLFDQGAVAKGFHHLSLAQKTNSMTRYHLEAGLAGAIVSGADSAEILFWHRAMVQFFPSPMVLLSHAIAIGAHEGASSGLEALTKLAGDGAIEATPNYYAALGFFTAQLGEAEAAAQHYRKAVARGMSQPTRRSLEKRIEDLGAKLEA